MHGADSSLFAPCGAANRALAAVTLYRLEGSPAVEGENSFTDAPLSPETLWYYNAVTWAAQNGILTGYEDGAFRPGANITREQLAAAFYNYARYKGYDVAGGIGGGDASDGKTGSAGGGNDTSVILGGMERVSPWARDAMTWAAHIGLLKNAGNGAITPGNAGNGTVTGTGTVKDGGSAASETAGNGTGTGTRMTKDDGSAMPETAGSADGSVDPKGDVSRAEIAAMLRSFVDYYHLEPPENGNGAGAWKPRAQSAQAAGEAVSVTA